MRVSLHSSLIAVKNASNSDTGEGWRLRSQKEETDADDCLWHNFGDLVHENPKTSIDIKQLDVLLMQEAQSQSLLKSL